MKIWRVGELVVTPDDLYFACPCGADMEWGDDGDIVCPNCGRKVSREEYFESIGVEPPTIMCTMCLGHYPQCSYDCPELP